MTSEQMWAIYAQGIAQAAGLSGAPEGFILNGTSDIANFATASAALPKTAVPTTQQALYQIYNLANTEVSLQGIYSPVNQQFFNDYATYIDNLVPTGSQNAPTPTQTAQLTLLRNTLSTQTTQYQTDITAAAAAWNTQGTLFPGQYPTFQSFLNQTTWGSTLQTDTAAISGTNSQINSLMTTIYGQDYVAIALAKQTVDGVRTAMTGAAVTSPADMMVAADSGNLIVPTYNPSSLATFSSWVDTVISQHGNDSSAISISFTANSAQYDFSQSQYFSHTSWSTDYFFFSVGHSSTTSSSQLNIDTTNSDFSLTMKFDAITELDLTRGPWYDSSLMYNYTNPDSLATPVKLYIGMYPSVTMTMDASDYTAAKSAYQSSSGIGVGIFWIAAGGNSNSSSSLQMSASWNDATNSVTLSSSSIEPVILAMQVQQV